MAMNDQFLVNLLRPFVYLVIWVLFVWPVTLAMQRYMRDGWLKRLLLKRWGDGRERVDSGRPTDDAGVAAQQLGHRLGLQCRRCLRRLQGRDGR